MHLLKKFQTSSASTYKVIWQSGNLFFVHKQQFIFNNLQQSFLFTYSCTTINIYQQNRVRLYKNDISFDLLIISLPFRLGPNSSEYFISLNYNHVVLLIEKRVILSGENDLIFNIKKCVFSFNIIIIIRLYQTGVIFTSLMFRNYWDWALI